MTRGPGSAESRTNAPRTAPDRPPPAPAARGHAIPAVTVAATVAVTVAAALILNLAIYGLGRAAGGDFLFTAAGRPAEVDALTVAGFTVLPLLVGMTMVAALARVWRWVVPAALVIAPALALGTVPLMTLPADLDTTSKLALALCHVALVPVTVTGLLRLRRPRPERPTPSPSTGQP
ncbi:hypothetical protein Nocox_02230 [Nonomuraea coxensis DSM 45129]|uniref:Uncharacterized protein n=1 Tax=Nonomuraea coxensis DSM 45129 TaxID=1122611 RepID=A0ABX8TT05_9ACTN|nr:DUF6069 family protein [Nonomuraea coxensis]QYC38079.1 hypothetical protein Nocox_02230 [Nonomuraea coxensis DSM 45129]